MARRTRISATVVMLVLFNGASAHYPARAADPQVPAGRDPGGYPVAVIGSGIDYTQPHLANMLARDGEGEIIGYDFIDDDRRPYAALGTTDSAEILTAEGQAATLVVVRADTSSIQSLANAIGYAAKSPAIIVAIFRSEHARDAAKIVSAAATRFPSRLFIFGGDETQPVSAANLIVVTGVDGKPTPATTASDQNTFDLAVSTAGLWQRPVAKSSGKTASPSDIAVARTAALAARLRAVATDASAADLKTRILELAEPIALTEPKAAKGGWIAEPRRHFWLE